MGGWHALHVNWTCKDREVGSPAIGNICSCVTFLVKVSIPPVTTKEGCSSMDYYAVLSSGSGYFDCCFGICLLAGSMKVVL